MRREVRATANRLANFDDANLRRSARAAVAAGARVRGRWRSSATTSPSTCCGRAAAAGAQAGLPGGAGRARRPAADQGRGRRAGSAGCSRWPTSGPRTSASRTPSPTLTAGDARLPTPVTWRYWSEHVARSRSAPVRRAGALLGVGWHVPATGCGHGRASPYASARRIQRTRGDASVTVRVGINGFGRIGRNFFRAVTRSGRRHRDRRGQRPHRHRDPGPPAQVRHDPGPPRRASTPPTTPSRSTARPSRCSPSATRPSCPGATWASTSSSSPPASSPRPPRPEAHRRRRQEGHHLGARQGRGHHHRHGRQRRQVRPATHHIISNASCTTNCLAPLAKVLHDNVRHRRA